MCKLTIMRMMMMLEDLIGHRGATTSEDVAEGHSRSGERASTVGAVMSAGAMMDGT